MTTVEQEHFPVPIYASVAVTRIRNTARVLNNTGKEILHQGAGFKRLLSVIHSLSATLSEISFEKHFSGFL